MNDDERKDIEEVNLNEENDNEKEELNEENVDPERSLFDDVENEKTEKISLEEAVEIEKEIKDEREKEPIYSGYIKEMDEKRKEENRLRLLVREEILRNYKPKRNYIGILALVLIGAILGSFITGGINAFMNRNIADNKNTPITIKAGEKINVENAVSKKASPSVVGILTRIKTSPMGQGFFFGLPGEDTYSEAIGSGVIVSKDGYILTNSHVVNNGDYEGDITCVLVDGSKDKAKLLWYDETLDLAIVKINKENLIPIEIGDSSKVNVGDKAIAIGNPLALNLQSTLTSGYISGLQRSITMEDGSVMDGLIQTDAAINGGNSGGALLNSEGKLIGINTAKANQADGIGFAIPVNVCIPIVKKVIETGSFETVFIGIQGIGLQTYSNYYSHDDYPTDKGVLVVDVVRGSLASEAGLEKGDIIVGLDNYEIGSMSQLKQALINYEYGDRVNIKFYHGKNLVEKQASFHEIGSNRT